MIKSEKYAIYIAGITSACAYFMLAHFVERTAFFSLLAYFSICFAGYYFLRNISFKVALTFGIVFRILFLIAIPALSQDFYRFIWDGRLLALGGNPFLDTPNQILSHTHIFDAHFLVAKMGDLSANNFSNYPPLNQAIFGITAWLSRDSLLLNLILFRIIIILADVGIFFFLRKILSYLKKPTHFANLYFLNPLVIIELTGNLHFEGVMMFFFALALYLLICKKYYSLSALMMACSILIKLLPLLLLPFILRKIGFKASIKYYSLCIFICILSFAFFYDPLLIQHYTKTVGLWFGKFEFNASIYYLFREVGFWITGYNIIGILGKLLPVSVLAFMGYLSLKKGETQNPQFLTYMLISLSAYFFVSTTVHPWYLITLLFLNVFANFRYVWVWSYTVILSYFAYSNPDFKESPWLLFIEYLPVYYLFIQAIPQYSLPFQTTFFFKKK